MTAELLARLERAEGRGIVDEAEFAAAALKARGV